MRVQARGWKRDCGANEIMSADLEEGYRDAAKVSTYVGGKVYLRTKSSGDVDILTGPHNLTLGGKYQTILTLTSSDIMCLFVEAFRGAKFLDTISALVEIAQREDDGGASASAAS